MDRHGYRYEVNVHTEHDILQAREQHTGVTRVSDVSFVDDTCIMLAANSFDELEGMAVDVLGATNNVFATMGLRLKYKRNKTEAMVSFRGAGSRAARSQWTAADTPGISFETAGQQYFVHLVMYYTHLGSIVSSDGSLKREVRRRAARLAGPIF